MTCTKQNKTSSHYTNEQEKKNQAERRRTTQCTYSAGIVSGFRSSCCASSRRPYIFQGYIVLLLYSCASIIPSDVLRRPSFVHIFLRPHFYGVFFSLPFFFLKCRKPFWFFIFLGSWKTFSDMSWTPFDILLAQLRLGRRDDGRSLSLYSLSSPAANDKN